MTRRSRIFLLAILIIGAVTWWWMRANRSNAWPIVNEHPTGANIIAFGDSLTYGYEVPPAENYPALLSKRLGKPIINAGINGNTTADGLARLDRDVLAKNPRIVLICLAGNDMTHKLPVDQTFNNLRQMIDRIHQRGALVVLIGLQGDGLVYPSDQGPLFKKLAQETGCVYFPNFMDGVLRHPDLMHDPLHPNAKGYEIIADRMMDEVGEYLRR